MFVRREELLMVPSVGACGWRRWSKGQHDATHWTDQSSPSTLQLGKGGGNEGVGCRSVRFPHFYFYLYLKQIRHKLELDLGWRNVITRINMIV